MVRDPSAQRLAGRGEAAQALGNVRGPTAFRNVLRRVRHVRPRRRGVRLAWAARSQRWSLRARLALAKRKDFPTCLTRVARAWGVRSSGARASGRTRTRARVNRPPCPRARAGRALGHVVAWAPPSPPLLPLSLHLGFFLSSPFFLFFQ